MEFIYKHLHCGRFKNKATKTREANKRNPFCCMHAYLTSMKKVTSTFLRMSIRAKHRLSRPICWKRPHPAMTMSKQPEDQGHSKINLTNLPQSLCAPVDFSRWLMHGNAREGSNAALWLNSLCYGLVSGYAKLTVALRNRTRKDHNQQPT